MKRNVIILVVFLFGGLTACGSIKNPSHDFLETVIEKFISDNKQAETTENDITEEETDIQDQTEYSPQEKDNSPGLSKPLNIVTKKKTISAGRDYIVAIHTDGTVISTGRFDEGQRMVDDWTDIVEVSAGYTHTLGLKSDGTVIATGWRGENKTPEKQTGVTGWTDIISVAAGAYHSVGLKSDGTVVAVGFNASGQCNVSDWRDIVAIAAGENYTIGLKSNGTVVAVGNNDGGQCTGCTEWRDIVAVSAGGGVIIGLKSDGTVISTGNTAQDIHMTNIMAISSVGLSVIGLQPDGRVVDSDGEYLNDWTDIVAISKGRSFTMGLKSDGTVEIIGGPEGQENEYQMIVHRDFTDIRLPN